MSNELIIRLVRVYWFAVNYVIAIFSSIGSGSEPLKDLLHQYGWQGSLCLISGTLDINRVFREYKDL